METVAEVHVPGILANTVLTGEEEKEVKSRALSRSSSTDSLYDKFASRIMDKIADLVSKLPRTVSRSRSRSKEKKLRKVEEQLEYSKLEMKEEESHRKQGGTSIPRKEERKTRGQDKSPKRQKYDNWRDRTDSESGQDRSESRDRMRSRSPSAESHVSYSRQQTQCLVCSLYFEKIDAHMSMVHNNSNRNAPHSPSLKRPHKNKGVNLPFEPIKTFEKDSPSLKNNFNRLKAVKACFLEIGRFDPNNSRQYSVISFLQDLKTTHLETLLLTEREFKAQIISHLAGSAKEHFRNFDCSNLSPNQLMGRLVSMYDM